MAPTDFNSVVMVIVDLITLALPVIFGLSVLVFVWGLVKFIFRVGGDEKAISDGKKLMVWGLIALFIVISLMSILAFASNEIPGFGSGWPLLPQGN
ncbi:MAG: hypothetical protein AAB719_01155 [Patescibacteria group bacterium]